MNEKGQRQFETEFVRVYENQAETQKSQIYTFANKMVSVVDTAWNIELTYFGRDVRVQFCQSRRISIR